LKRLLLTTSKRWRADPDYAEAHYNLGTALVRLDRVPEAIEQWKEALRIDPDYAEAHANLGVALEQAGKLEDAVAHYEQGAANSARPRRGALRSRKRPGRGWAACRKQSSNTAKRYGSNPIIPRHGMR